MICSYIGMVGPAEHREIYQAAADILEQTGQHLYRLSNYTAVTSSFADVMAIAKEIGAGIPGSASDPRITAVIIGTHQWTTLAIEMVKRPQFGGIQVALFNTVQDGLMALRLCRREVARSRAAGEQWA
jgi:hypothetical protein